MKRLLKILMWLGVLFFVVFFLEKKLTVFNDIKIQKNSVQKKEEKKVILENPKEIQFGWEYAGKEYFLEEKLYASLFEFYSSSPKSYVYKGEIPKNWEENYFLMFLKKNPIDDSISKIVSDIEELGKTNGLNQDQVVELVVSFVQDIPYDFVYAEEVLQGNGKLKYPYETLFENKGICSDKSFLLVGILSELGYGSALLSFENEKHMAVGIKCPIKYSNYEEGYCYIETTSLGFRIGMVPTIDLNKGVAISMEKREFLEETQSSQFDAKKLGKPKIYPITEGNIYKGVENSLMLAKKIDALKIELENNAEKIILEKKEVEGLENDLLELEKKLNKAKNKGDIEKYNDLVLEYNELLEKYKKKTEKYNQKIRMYNQKIKEYNILIRNF